jgi:hypothetical protein
MDSAVVIASHYMLYGMGLNPGGGEIFPNHPDQSRDLHNLLQNEYQVSFIGVKQMGVWH